MKIKELFKMIENANAFNELVGERKRNYIELQYDKVFHFSIKDENDYSRFYNFKEFKKALNYNFNKEEIEKIINADFEQEKEYKNYFNFNDYNLGICEE